MLIKILELFAGSRSVGKEAEIMGYEVYSSDINKFKDINYVSDILDFDTDKIPFIPDVIWASPPCTYFSVASIGKHWNIDNTPKTANAVLGVKIVQKTIDIIKHYQQLNPNLIYFVENPRGKLRKLPVAEFFKQRHTVTYCQYGDNRMKPTDVVGKGDRTVFKSGKSHPKWYADALVTAKTPEERRTLRSKTFNGISKAMATQWSNI